MRLPHKITKHRSVYQKRYIYIYNESVRYVSIKKIRMEYLVIKIQ